MQNIFEIGHFHSFDLGRMILVLNADPRYCNYVICMQTILNQVAINVTAQINSEIGTHRYGIQLKLLPHTLMVIVTFQDTKFPLNAEGIIVNQKNRYCSSSALFCRQIEMRGCIRGKLRKLEFEWKVLTLFHCYSTEVGHNIC